MEHNAITAGQFTKALVKHHEDYLYVVILNKLCPKYLKNGGKDLESENSLSDEKVVHYSKEIENIVTKSGNGKFGKTPQCDMKLIKLAEPQRLLQYVIKTNNYEMRLLLSKMWILLCFARNHFPYDRYGAYYVNFLKNIDNTHPTAIE